MNLRRDHWRYTTSVRGSRSGRRAIDAPAEDLENLKDPKTGSAPAVRNVYPAVLRGRT